MKTITIDYDSYEKEKEEIYFEGVFNSEIELTERILKFLDMEGDFETCVHTIFDDEAKNLMGRQDELLKRLDTFKKMLKGEK